MNLVIGDDPEELERSVCFDMALVCESSFVCFVCQLLMDEDHRPRAGPRGTPPPPNSAVFVVLVLLLAACL